MNRRAPFIVEIEITLRCPLRCIHCYSRGGEDQREYSTEQVKSILRQLHASGVEIVDIVGGEPFIRKDIFDILEYARKLGQKVMVNTNGVLLDESKVRKLKEVYPDLVLGVSIDGASAKTCDYVRGTGTFQKALNAVELLVRAGFKVVPLFVVNRMNWREFGEYVRMMKDKGVHGIYVDRFVPVGRGRENASVLDMDVEEWFEALKYIHDVVRRESENIVFYLEESIKLERCSAGYSHASILNDGRVVPCGHFRYQEDFVMGNILEQDFSEIWWNYRGLTMNNDECEYCPLFPSCGGGCPAYSIAKNGRFGKDEVACMFKRREKVVKGGEHRGVQTSGSRF